MAINYGKGKNDLDYDLPSLHGAAVWGLSQPRKIKVSKLQ